MGKKVNCAGDSEAMDYNHKAVKASSGRTGKADTRATDYSIPSKKLTSADLSED